MGRQFQSRRSQAGIPQGAAPRSNLCHVLPGRGACAGAENQRAYGPGSENEKALIDAVATRYTEDPTAERPKLDAAFADATAALSDKNPDDLELAVLAAEAAMDTQPWDYWEPGGKAPAPPSGGTPGRQV